MRASGWPKLIGGSSDWGSSPVTYRNMFCFGGTFLPKNVSFCEVHEKAKRARDTNTESATNCFPIELLIRNLLVKCSGSGQLQYRQLFTLLASSQKKLADEVY